jgi:hypothetical protein
MKRTLAAVSIAMVALGSPSGAAAQDAGAPDAKPPVNAVWVEREFQLSYMAFTSFYSCDGLRDKVAWVLKELGARPDFKVTSRACTRTSGPAMMPAFVAAAGGGHTDVPGEIMARRSWNSPRHSQAAPSPEYGRLPRRCGGSVQERPDRRQDTTAAVEQLRDQVMAPPGARIVDDHARVPPG